MVYVNNVIMALSLTGHEC